MVPVCVRIHDLRDGGARFPFHGWIGAGYPEVDHGFNSFLFFRGLIGLEYSALAPGINSF